jgi:rod shape-determining protein MreB
MLAKLFAGLAEKYYLVIEPGRIALTRLSGDKPEKLLDEPPFLAIQGGKLLAIGREAEKCRGNPGVDVANPFAHPRTLLADFTQAEALVKACFKRAAKGRLLQLAPILLLHPIGKDEGGYTQIEQRAFQELGRGAGALRTCLCEAPQEMGGRQALAFLRKCQEG